VRDGGVHDAEMPATPYLDERAVEAFLAGRSAAAAEVGPLATFADDLRVAASGPAPAPTPQLSRLLTEGFSIDDGALPVPAATATRAGSRAARPPTPRRRTMTISQLLAALAAKLAGLGMAAKAALGLALATASVASAGAAGVLPDPAQHAVATVVNATSPLHIPDTTDADDSTKTVTDLTGSGVPDVGGVTDPADDGVTGDVPGTDDAGQPADNHGACVSAVAHDAPRGPGGVHGRAVSEAAKACPKPADDGDDHGGATTTTSTTVAGTGGVTTTDDHSGPGGGQGDQGHGQSGEQHGHGGGEGNSGHGNSGQHGN
jgi:hypothetical protein